MIVVDTNVISEMLKPRPAKVLAEWWATQPAPSLFTTAVTQAEILLGLRLLPVGRRRRALEAAIMPIFSEDFAGRVLPFDEEAADAYADIALARRRAGRPISQADAQIAAIAASRGARLATRDVGGFADTGIAVLNPWGA